MEASVSVCCLGFPWEPKAESRQAGSAQVQDCLLGEVSGQPCAAVHRGLPRPSLQVEIRTVFDGCGVKALSCTAGGSGLLAVESRDANTSPLTPEWAPSNPWWCFSFH